MSLEGITLGLDLDGTTVDFNEQFRGYLARKYGLTHEESWERYPEPSRYSFVESGWFLTLDDFLRDFHEAEEDGMYRRMSLFEGAGEVIKEIAARGVNIHVVTARNVAWKDDTTASLVAHGLQEFISSQNHTEAKETMIRPLGVDVFLDDSDKQITTLRSHGSAVIAFDNPTNRHVDADARVTRWQELPEALTSVVARLS